MSDAELLWALVGSFAFLCAASWAMSRVARWLDSRDRS